MTRHPVELIMPDGQVIRLEVAEGEAIWDAAARRGVELPSTCLQGWCLSCAGRVLEGDWEQSQSLRYYPEDKGAGFILLCTATPLSPLKIETNQKEEMRQHRIRRGLPTPRG